jgi:HEAT repeat protein
MRALLVFLLVACGDKREAVPAPPVRSAKIEVPHVVQPELPTKPVAPGLAADLKDSDVKVRRAAVREAALDANADPQIFLAASHDPDREVGVAATEALGKMHARGQVPANEMLARATDKSLDERVRVTAINGLGTVASPEAAKALAELVHRGDVLERRSAAILLAHQDVGIAIPALIDALGDADDVVRTNAQETLRLRARGRDFGSDAAAWRAWWTSRSM